MHIAPPGKQWVEHQFIKQQIKKGMRSTYTNSCSCIHSEITYRQPFTHLSGRQIFYLSPFVNAWKSDAQDFSLNIDNPKEPKILVVGNNPDRQNTYSAALDLYNSRIVKLTNKKEQFKSSVIIDELPLIYFHGLDSLIPAS